MINKYVFVFGGLRGLSYSLSQIYNSNGTKVVVFTRSKDIDIASFTHCEHVHFLDVDSSDSLDNTFSYIKHFFQTIPFDSLSIHYLYGGGKGISDTYEDSQNLDVASLIFRHNVLVPYKLTSHIIHCFETNKYDSDRLLHFAFYSSAVVSHLKAHPLYISSKAALESLFMTLVKSRISSTYFSLFRLGMVNVNYKYFSKLSFEHPKKFASILSDNVPSNYFPSTDEIAEFVFTAMLNPSVSNGIICDISGGNSWI